MSTNYPSSDEYTAKMKELGLIRCPNCLDWHEKNKPCECEKNE